MSTPYNKLTTTIDLAAIRHNWTLLNERGGNAMAVIKCDAYGHGLFEVARALAKQGARTFATGTVEEAVSLRHSGALGRDHQIISLLGPIDKREYREVVDNAIIPFVGNFEQLNRLAAMGRPGSPVHLALKFDTGMARLGFSEDEVDKVLALLDGKRTLRPVMASSHLATADDPAQDGFVQEQGARFRRILERLTAGGYPVEASLANSGAILTHPELGLSSQRAGIALYGTNPFLGTDREREGAGLKQAMHVSAPILEVRRLAAGRSVSYGRTFTAERDMTIAIVGAGYADGYSRSLSNRAGMCLRGVRVPVVGRVCMQMTAVDLTPLDGSGVKQARVGDRIWLLGGKGRGFVSASEMASWWGTITYEVFCLLGMNRKSYI